MSDVASILGVSASASGNKPLSESFTMSARSSRPPTTPAAATNTTQQPQPSRAHQLQAMPREVMDAMMGKRYDRATADLPPIVPTATTSDSVKVGTKWISKYKPARTWVWAPFSSSSRTDGALFYHWVRAHVEYADYPYARFDIHLDPVTYTDEEYQRYLTVDTWTQSETDQLMEFARIYELRWPVIYDRWIGEYYDSKEDRKIEDLQHRYYQVAAILAQSRISQQAALEVQALSNEVAPDPTTSEQNKQIAENLLLETAAARSLASSDPQHQPLISNLGTGSTNKVFDLQQERKRRAYMEAMWNRTRAEEEEDAALRQELKQVEAQLRRIKKQGGHILAAVSSALPGGAAMSGGIKSARSSRNPSRSVSPVPGGGTAMGETLAQSPAFLDQALASTAPTPTPGFPYLQSGRLAQPATGGPSGINKSLLNRMETVLAEMKVPPRPIPTKRVCDLYDNVRKDTLTLLVLQKNLLQKEGLVESKRLKLAKMGGNVRVVQEETLLGITPTPAPAPAAVPAATAPTAAAAAAAVTTNTTTTATNTSTTATTTATAAVSKPKSKPTKSKSTGGGTSNSKSARASTDKAVKADEALSSATVHASSAMPAPPANKDTSIATTIAGGAEGKSAKKAAPKRKRKSEAKSPSAAAAAAASISAPAATAGTSAAPAISATTVAAAAAKSSEVISEPKSHKKRPKKAAPTG
jgi:DNA methyltransferase 1-associated protein 1